jgi:oxepin-CoA hydrolase/3-oxo-5,6-dehydrosuberyl-CoA semialdehyde dehydrogenase
LLKELAKHLSSDKEEFYALSLRTGATRRDSMVDVDGGFGTLFSYASKGACELPNDTVVLDGGQERLGREGSFVGQHLFTSRLGVAVQVNAFNFPVWGMLEKLAPAFLAGLPSIVKPASQTAYVAEAVVRRIVDSGILPEGSLQLVCGSAGTLLDELGEQDSVAFTGSAHTAGILRNHPAVLHRGVRLGVEADSLNCSILGPDVTPEDPRIELFVEGVVTEMTVKAGQNCTAIRRALVPEPLAGAVLEAISDRLANVTVGNPAEESVRMGPLASLAQREEVRKAIDVLRASADHVYGDPDSVDVVGADAEHGAFLSPILLKARPGAVEPHEVEPFGPVSTVIGYTSTAEAVELAGRGRGSLVASLVTHDPAVARQVALGLAPWHGRLLVLDRDDAAEAAAAGGHGSPLPTLVHGGPGRAGGGEELGGVRGVLHHMQRTALQASPDMITAITGRWTTGSQRITGEVHPFRKSLAELRIGDTIHTATREVTLADIGQFAELTGDTFYAHTDPEAAAANPLFGGIVAHGYLVVSRSTSVEAHRGQRTARRVGASDSATGPSRRGAGPGGEIPASASAAFPAGVIQSVVQAGCRATFTPTSPNPSCWSRRTQVVAHRRHRRTPGVRRCDRHDHGLVVADLDVTEDAELGQGQHRQLGVDDGRRNLPGTSPPIHALGQPGHQSRPRSSGRPRARRCTGAGRAWSRSTT